MLQLIHIENIAVIERAELAFGSGFNVLTGETGAGKSIVIDALNAVTGGRVTRELVRTGTAAAAVTAVFTGADVSGWLEDNGIDPDDDGGELVLSRRVSSDGKSVCRVNGTPVSAAQLRELGGTLVDIHGQNDGRKLLDDAAHRAYLDAFGGYPELLAEYGAAYAAVQVRRREMESAAMDESEKERRADTLRYQIDELERAELSPGETDALSERRELLRNSSHLTSALDAAYSALYGGEDTDGAAALITGAQADMDGAARYSGSFAALAGRLRDLRYAVQDAAEELREKRDALDFSPEELDHIDGRLDTLRRVTRKYGGGEDEALLYLEKCRVELGDIEYSGERQKQLEKELADAAALAGTLADELSERRRAAAGRLRTRITEELGRLNMSGVRFDVEFEPVRDAFALSPSGREGARFLMSANAGEAPGRISRIASGGELSRIMLALKNVLTENDDIASMVFDEVDAGVSGVAAQRVAEKLCDLARRRQVLCVTHLPQIAAMADAHFEISKSERGGRTVTTVRELDGDGRALEISRLIGGENITETTKKAAREQLDASRAYKRRTADGG